MIREHRRYITPEERSRIRDGDRFASTWFRHAESFWAWNSLSSLCQLEPDEAWRLILLLVEKAPSDADLGTIGLNPLTELLIFNGPVVIDRIETEAARNRRFRLCLDPVYQGEDEVDIAPEVWARIETIRAGVA